MSERKVLWATRVVPRGKTGRRYGLQRRYRGQENDCDTNQHAIRTAKSIIAYIMARISAPIRDSFEICDVIRGTVHEIPRSATFNICSLVDLLMDKSESRSEELRTLKLRSRRINLLLVRRLPLESLQHAKSQPYTQPYQNMHTHV